MRPTGACAAGAPTSLYVRTWSLQSSSTPRRRSGSSFPSDGFTPPRLRPRQGLDVLRAPHASRSETLAQPTVEAWLTAPGHPPPQAASRSGPRRDERHQAPPARDQIGRRGRADWYGHHGVQPCLLIENGCCPATRHAVRSRLVRAEVRYNLVSRARQYPGGVTAFAHPD
jgi:hypothetical protein